MRGPSTIARYSDVGIKSEFLIVAITSFFSNWAIVHSLEISVLETNERRVEDLLRVFCSCEEVFVFVAEKALICFVEQTVSSIGAVR